MEQKTEGKQCKICSKWNHFAKVCCLKQGEGVHTVSKISSHNMAHNADLFIDAVTQDSTIRDTDWAFADVFVGPKQSYCQL